MIMILINYYNFHSNLRAWVFNERPHSEKLFSVNLIFHPLIDQFACAKSQEMRGENCEITAAWLRQF